MGRHLQQEYGQEPQCILTMPLARGLGRRREDVQEQAQLHRHHRGRQHHVRQGAVDLGRADVALVHPAVLRSHGEIEALQKEVAAGRNPKDAKVMLARRSPRAFTAAAAEAALSRTSTTAARAACPTRCPEVSLGGAPLGIGAAAQAGRPGALDQRGQLRLIDGGWRACGFGAVVSDKGLKLDAGSYVVQVGKRKFARVLLG
jgi:tyrosyl-tRNA synthetase